MNIFQVPLQKPGPPGGIGASFAGQACATNDLVSGAGTKVEHGALHTAVRFPETDLVPIGLEAGQVNQ